MQSDAQDAPSAHDEAAREALERRCAEQLLDDESLRGELTDDEFTPAQNWALDVLHAHVAALPDPGAPDADAQLGPVLDGLRAALRAIDDAIGHRFDLDEAGFCDALQPVVAALPALVGDEAEGARARVVARLPALAAHRDGDDGAALVEALVAALRGTAAAGEA